MKQRWDKYGNTKKVPSRYTAEGKARKQFLLWIGQRAVSGVDIVLVVVVVFAVVVVILVGCCLCFRCS